MRRKAIKISPGIGNYYFCLEFVNELLFTEKLYKQWRECSIQPNIFKSVLVSIIICGNSGLSLN